MDVIIKAFTEKASLKVKLLACVALIPACTLISLRVAGIVTGSDILTEDQMMLLFFYSLAHFWIITRLFIAKRTYKLFRYVARLFKQDK